MNGFFSNLTARSFDLNGGMELVRPRLPSLFEPVREQPQDLSEMTSGLERSEVFDINSMRLPDRQEPIQMGPYLEGPDDPYRRSARTLENVQRTPYPSAETIEAVGRKSFVGGDPGSRSRVQSESQRDKPTYPWPEALERPIPSSPVRSETPVQPKAQMEPSAMSVRLDTVSRTVKPSDDERGVPREGFEQTPKYAVAPLVVEKVEMQEQIKRAVDDELPSRNKERDYRMNETDRPLIQPIVPALSRVEDVASRRTVSKPEPIIHVAIGRIEVRATSAPVQGRPKPREPAAMTLDEYLRRRKGGGQ
jgi:hypothetical protein